MITNIGISHYKSIESLEIQLGRVNVLVGENGAGKSNILEAIALAGAASARKLDNEFLVSRGIRVTPPEFMRPAFPESSRTREIFISAKTGSQEVTWELKNDNEPYSKWSATTTMEAGSFEVERFVSNLSRLKASISTADKQLLKKYRESLRTLGEALTKTTKELQEGVDQLTTSERKHINIKLPKEVDWPGLFTISNTVIDALAKFIIYSPENSALRTFSKEGQIEPLGTSGEGLLRLLSIMSSDKNYSDSLQEINESLKLLGWFEHFEIIPEAASSRIEIKDRYLDEARTYFNQLSANEGFLFLLFYFTLFTSKLTPDFFAIDNIDASLNPKLCAKLTETISHMAKKHSKQVILTTHNPAILDGLNLEDEDQRLFVVSRNRLGRTMINRVRKPTTPSEKPIRLSEAFLRGSLGGLPKGF